MRKICNPDNCTMCLACKNICPKGCIKDTFEDGRWYAAVDEQECINCGLCMKTCPNLVEPIVSTRNQLVVAWATDEQIRKKAASGGIASALYKHIIDEGHYICGVILEKDYKARYHLTNDGKNIDDFCNSKYTFSDVSECYLPIFELLTKFEDVLFVGLPCQCAGLINYLRTRNCSTEHLLLVDLVCHGTPHPDLLPQHIRAIENKYGFHAGNIFFRDPCFKTSRYAFTIYEEKNTPSTSPKYKKYVYEDDLYQIGYHNALIYRDNCYNCKYTKHERVGDLTLFDSTGLGKIESFKKKKNNTSFVLINTEKGEMILNKAQKKGLIEFERRPVEEAYIFNGQLNSPCKGIELPARKLFFELLDSGKIFDQAASLAFAEYVKLNRRFSRKIVRIIKSIIPASIKDYISRLRNRRE